MISIDRLKAVKTIVVHTNSDGACADGLAAELILRDVLPDAEVVLAQYGTRAYKELHPKPGVLFCDIVPFVERDKSGKMTEQGFAQAKAWVDAGTIVLDHHKGSADLVAMFGDSGSFADEKVEPGVSGAVLAFREVWTPLWRAARGQGHPQSVIPFALLAGVYDTWQKQDPTWGRARAQAFALRFWPRHRLVEAGLGEHLFELLRIGETLVEKHDVEVQRIVKSAFRFRVEGTRVAMFQSVSKDLTNDAADVLGAEADLAIGFELEVDECGTSFTKYSCRSRTQTDGSAFDCDAFAKRQGGGGHKHAAGFAVRQDPGQPLTHPYDQVSALLYGYLTTSVG